MMGREVMRVPESFVFPLDRSYADAWWEQHYVYCEECKKEDSRCDAYWRESVPAGEGWQLWNTVSDGPITPVFRTADELIDYMCQPDNEGRYGPYPDLPWAKGWKRETAEPFVKRVGWAPSAVMIDGKVMAGPEAMVKDR